MESLKHIAKRINDWLSNERITYLNYTMWVLAIVSAFLLWRFNAPLFWMSVGVILVVSPNWLTFPMTGRASHKEWSETKKRNGSEETTETETKKTESEVTVDFAKLFSILVVALGLWLISAHWREVFL